MRRVPALLLALTACTDLDKFALGEREIYRGPVVGADEADCVEGVACSFIRRGFVQGETLDLEFDPEGLDSVPGSLTSSEGACGRVFDGTELRNIAPLAHDQLALYDFPGGERLRNSMYVAKPASGPPAGRDVMIFMSLVRGEVIELRVIAGSGQSECAPDDCDARARGECDYFGVFRLGKEAR